MVVRYLQSQSSSGDDDDSSVEISPMAAPWSAACVQDIATLCNATLDWQSLQLCLATNSAQLSSSCMVAFIQEMIKVQLQLTNGGGGSKQPSDRNGVPSPGNHGQGSNEPGDSDDIDDGGSDHGSQEKDQDKKHKGSPGDDQPRPQLPANKGGAPQGHDARDQKPNGDGGHLRGNQNNGKKDYELSGSAALQGASGSLASRSSAAPHKSEGLANLDSHGSQHHGGGVHPLFWIFIFPFFCVGVYVSAKKALAYIKEQRMGGGRRPVESAEEYEPLQRS